MKNAIKSVRNCFENPNIIITKITQGRASMVRIDAKTRFHVADQDNFFSAWVSLPYANRLALNNYGKTVNNFNCYQY